MNGQRESRGRQGAASGSLGMGNAISVCGHKSLLMDVWWILSTQCHKCGYENLLTMAKTMPSDPLACQWSGAGRPR
jgi:hypothetical protein